MQHVIELPGETISSKNSKEIVYISRKGKRVPIIVSSKAYKRWEADMAEVLLQSPYRFYPWKYPLSIHFHFVRKTHGRWDYINLSQGPLDVLQKYGIIDDDDVTHVVPSRFTYEVDKLNPKLIMTIEEYSGNS